MTPKAFFLGLLSFIQFADCTASEAATDLDRNTGPTITEYHSIDTRSNFFFLVQAVERPQILACVEKTIFLIDDPSNPEPNFSYKKGHTYTLELRDGENGVLEAGRWQFELSDDKKSLKIVAIK